MRISDWSSDVCSSDLGELCREFRPHMGRHEIIERRQHHLAIIPAQETVILGMGVGIADDQIEDGSVGELQHLARGARGSLASARKTISVRRPTPARIYPVCRRAAPLCTLFLVQPDCPAFLAYAIGTGAKHMRFAVNGSPFQAEGRRGVKACARSRN